MEFSTNGAAESKATPGYTKLSSHGCAGRNELGAFNGETVESCMTRCSAARACISFEFHPYALAKNVCQLSSTCDERRARANARITDLYIKQACFDQATLDACLRTRASSKYHNGCRAYASGWAKGTHKCSLCGTTVRAYKACDSAECAALCQDLYDRSGSHDRIACTSGCSWYAKASTPQALAREAVAKAEKSLSEAGAALKKSGAAQEESRKTLVKMEEQHKLLVATQGKAEAAHKQARRGKQESAVALKGARSASKKARSSLVEAQKADNDAAKVEGVVRTQEHTLHSLEKAQESLNVTLTRVNAMQTVDENLLQVTNHATHRLELGLGHQRNILTTIEHMQEFDHHSYKTMNSTIKAVKHTLDQTADTVSDYGKEIEDSKAKLADSKAKQEELETEVKQEQEQIQSQQKALKVTSFSTLTVVLLYLARKCGAFGMTHLGHQAKNVVVGRYRGSSKITVTVRKANGTTLSGPRRWPGVVL